MPILDVKPEYSFYAYLRQLRRATLVSLNQNRTLTICPDGGGLDNFLELCRWNDHGFGREKRHWG